MKLDKGRCLGASNRMSWSYAPLTIGALNQQGGYASFRDWRLPTLKELSTLVEQKCGKPSIIRKIFPDTPNLGFWSSTEHTIHQQAAWLVFFPDGDRYIGNKNYEWAVRLVRN